MANAIPISSTPAILFANVWHDFAALAAFIIPEFKARERLTPGLFLIFILWSRNHGCVDLPPPPVTNAFKMTMSPPRIALHH